MRYAGQMQSGLLEAVLHFFWKDLDSAESICYSVLVLMIHTVHVEQRIHITHMYCVQPEARDM